MAKKDDLIVGVDVGTTKVVAVVADRNPSGLDIVGLGTAETKGIKNGVVINIDSTVDAIGKAIDDAELMAARTIGSVRVSLSGIQVGGFNSRGLVAVKNREVKREDVKRVIEAAQAIKIPDDRQVIHTLPQGYVIDDNDIMGSPVGMAGVRMEAKVHIVTCARNTAENLMACCTRNDLTVDGLIFGGLASSASVLDEDEKELGVVLADVGGGTTDLVIWHNNAVIHTASIPYAGQLITTDVAMGLRTPTHQAERIKCRYGCALANMVDEFEEIEVPGTGRREPIAHRRQVLAEIIEPRVEEIMYKIYDEIQKSGFGDLLGAGLVLTGGTAQLPGIDELASIILDMPVRIGRPNIDNIGGLVDLVSTPAHATVLGLTTWKLDDHSSEGMERDNRSRVSVLGSLKKWFQESF